MFEIARLAHHSFFGVQCLSGVAFISIIFMFYLYYKFVRYLPLLFYHPMLVVCYLVVFFLCSSVSSFLFQLSLFPTWHFIYYFLSVNICFPFDICFTFSHFRENFSQVILIALYVKLSLSLVLMFSSSSNTFFFFCNQIYCLTNLLSDQIYCLSEGETINFILIVKIEKQNKHLYLGT